jgi:hypothetical protein
LPHQIDKNIFQRALRRLDVLEADPGGAEIVEQRGDAGALPLGVVAVDQLLATGRQRELVGGERRRDEVDDPVQFSVNFLPSLCRAPALSSTRMSSP